MKENFSILKKETLHEGFFELNKFKVKFKGPGGEQHTAVMEETERGDAACAVLYDPEEKTVILVRQFRFSARKTGDEYMLELPAGMIDDGESGDDAIRREILEETGYSPAQFVYMGDYYLSPGGSTERILIYFARIRRSDRKETGGGRRDENEDIDLVRLPLTEMIERIVNGNISDAKTVLGILLATNGPLKTDLAKMA